MVRATTAAIGGVLVAGGMLSAGNAAFAHTQDSEHGPAPAPAPVQHTTDAHAPAPTGLIGVSAPVNADLHDGIANNLDVRDVARDVAVVGDVVPANQAQAKSSDASQKHEVNHHASAAVDGKAAHKAGAHAQAPAPAPAAPAAGLDLGKATGPVTGTVTGTLSGVTSHVEQTVQAVGVAGQGASSGVHINAGQ